MTCRCKLCLGGVRHTHGSVSRMTSKRSSFTTVDGVCSPIEIRRITAAERGPFGASWARDRYARGLRARQFGPRRSPLASSAGNYPDIFKWNFAGRAALASPAGGRRAPS
ncbi:hypothetical protein EVAR_7880_1 [Eumeta japonica]|uniref:Uncharacterized protein n=1 Tax=Eumeta variegata TaxID=151549 RepID=A0A4C1TV54_EUMVA|nr:hypothetical protein EVAR_7880_1 [Eumeta japonica]